MGFNSGFKWLTCLVSVTSDVTDRNERPSFPFKYWAVWTRWVYEAFESAERLTAMTDPEKYRNLRWNSSCVKGGDTKEHQTEDFQGTLYEISLAWRCYIISCHRRLTGVLRNQDPRPDIKIIFHWMMKCFIFACLTTYACYFGFQFRGYQEALICYYCLELKRK
jgi:hypothetical protein